MIDSCCVSNRKFLRSAWGWTCTFAGSFILLLSLSARHRPSLTLCHLSRLGVGALLWWGSRCLLTFLEDAAGACFEPMPQAGDGEDGALQGQPSLLLLHEDQTRASCLRGNMVWRGYEVSQDVLILSWCCLLLAEEMSIFGAHLNRSRTLSRPPGGPLRFLFLLCALLLALWLFLLLCLLAHFPKFPSQQLGGAVGYLGWRGLYQGWYRVKPSCFWGGPVLPGEGLFADDVDSGKQRVRDK